ncbi:MAG: response regulator [Terracidiphilus sp.]
MSATARNGKILIVDDEVHISETLSLVFSAQGYEVRAANSAEQAVEILAHWQPDVAVLDVMLPQMNGIDLALVIQSNYPACRLLLISGHPETGALLEEARAKGHRFDILAKPVHPAYILAAVSDLLYIDPS